jgi:hypothetical protein
MIHRDTPRLAGSASRNGCEEGRALKDLPKAPKLLALAEHDAILDKIVLWDDPTGFQVWLHVFLPGVF